MLDITIFDGAKKTAPCAMQYTWDDLCDLFEEASREPWDRSAKLGRLGYIPGRLTGTRAAVNVVHLCFGSFDIDLAGDHPSYIDFPTMKSKLDALGVAYILVTTTKSLAAGHRYRLILRFEQHVEADQYVALWHDLNDQFGGIFDRSTHDLSRLSFFPADWRGLPRDTKGEIISDWPARHAYQAFACARSGTSIPIPDFATLKHHVTAPAVRKSYRTHHAPADPIVISPAAQAMLNECAAMTPPKDSVGYRFATDPTHELYVGEQTFGDVPGGRMFRFLCRVATRAFRRKLPINTDLLFDLATAVNAENAGSFRPDLRREVERALAISAQYIADA